jgi:hypothetical protein
LLPPAISFVFKKVRSLPERRSNMTTIQDQFVANIPPELFDILGVRPAVGRGFNATDMTRAAQPVAMISYALWLSLFHEQPLQRHLTLTVGRGPGVDAMKAGRLTDRPAFVLRIASPN